LAWNLPRELKKEEYQLLHRLRFIQLVSAGADHLPFSDIPPQVKIASNVGAYAEPMAEHILAMTLALSKRLLKNHNKLAQGEFNQFEVNKMLADSTVGIIGFGGIGRAAAKLFRCLGCRIYAINTSGKTEEEVDFVGNLKGLEYVLRESDVVILSIALNKQTYNLIGKRELGWMKHDAILVSVARGALIDEEALYEHLKSCPDLWQASTRGGLNPSVRDISGWTTPFAVCPISSARRTILRWCPGLFLRPLHWRRRT